MIVVYCANQKLYSQLPTTINSLLKNNPEVKKIYLLIEDDFIPYINHPKIIFINCNQFDFLIKEGINCTRRFSYMALTRCFLSKILNEKKIIYLDVDTIINDNLKELWNFNLGSACLAGRAEQGDYLNSGVLLMNLELIRKLNYEDTFCNLLTKCKMMYPDQDALNIIFKTSKKKLPKKFNILGTKEPFTEKIVIRHFAGLKKPWQEGEHLNIDIELYNKYKIDYIKEE